MAAEEETPDAWRSFETRLHKEMDRRDRRVADKLSEQAADHHREMMVVVTEIRTQQETHNRWMLARDAAQAVIDRAAAEQAQKELWLAEEQAKEDKVKAAKRARWAPYLPIGLTALGGYGAASLLYLLENLSNLHWDIQTKSLLGGMIAAMLISVAILRYVSGGV